MTRFPLSLLCSLSAALLLPAGAEPPAPPRTIPLDADWRFFQGDAPGAEKPEFDDAKWRSLSVPHDWSIEGAIDQAHPAGEGGAFLPTGLGWYRKSFTLPPGAAGRRVFVELDGVMANSDVWINGRLLGHRPSGYVGLWYELTEHLRPGEKAAQVLTVKADTSAQPASRWYAGSGLYRHVRLVLTGPVHLEHGGTFLTTPLVSAEQATVQVQTAVVNQSAAPQSEVAVETTVYDPAGQAVGHATSPGQALAAGATAAFAVEIPVSRPQRWGVAQPSLYRAETRVRSGGSTLDEETTTFGIRQGEFRAETGFWLNGENLKIKGVCLHYDGGAVGMAVPLSIWERRLDALRGAGVNAIRLAHSAAAPEFLDLCDRKGFLVLSELFDAWEVAKRKYDYHLFFPTWWMPDLTDVVRRDRNHPCIILYSAGNEIHDTSKPDAAKAILSRLLKAFQGTDPTRPVTQALFRPNVTKDYSNGLADLLDVVGQNYRENEILAAYRDNPQRKIIGTENTHVRAAWLALRDNPPYAGQFLWTGVDYLGEGYKWPAIGTSFGLLDRTGRKRAVWYQRASWWSTEPMVQIVRRVGQEEKLTTDPGYETAERNPEIFFPDWTPARTEPHNENVEVYSNAEETELFLNGRSLGRKSKPADDAPRTWSIPFEPGTLRAVARTGGAEVATHELRTAGQPARLALTTDRPRLAAAWDDVSFVTATIVDKDGVPVPSAQSTITFALRGPGALAGVDNGDNRSHEPFQASQRQAWLGRCVALVRATAASGRITVTATAPGLPESTVEMEAIAPKAEGWRP